MLSEVRIDVNLLPGQEYALDTVWINDRYLDVILGEKMSTFINRTSLYKSCSYRIKRLVIFLLPQCTSVSNYRTVKFSGFKIKIIFTHIMVAW